MKASPTLISLGKLLVFCRKSKLYIRLFPAIFITDQKKKNPRGGRKLNGIIYLHRISDPRMGGAAKKNLRVFREICGDERLDHVRIVTTNWNIVDEKQGNSRQDALVEGAFGLLIKEGAYLCRHDKGLESAQSIMSQLIRQEPVTLKIQEELNAGRTLEDTSAGALIVEEMMEMKKKHDKEVEGLKKELENASKANNEELRLELAEERRKLEEMMARAEEDRKTLKKTRVPRETLKLHAEKQVQPAEMEAAIVVSAIPSSPLLPQHYRPQRQGNETTTFKSRLPQIFLFGFLFFLFLFFCFFIIIIIIINVM